MKFIVSRKKISLTESRKPCAEALEAELTPLDYRTVATLKEAEGKIWYRDWMEGGENHREEGGMVVCEKTDKVKRWVVELQDLEGLLAFQANYGDIQISESSPFIGVKKEITIL